MVLANLFSPALPAAMYLALNPLPARLTGNGNWAAFAEFGQVNLAKHSATAFPADIQLTHF